MHKKGFTLVELLVVIGILAVLGTATAIVLNPAELLNQSRDAQRVGDLSNLVAALSIYLSDVRTPDLHDGGSGCKDQLTGGAATSGNEGFSYVDPTTASFVGSTTAVAATTGNVVTASRAVAGAGWMKVDFTDISAGAPFGVLPVDPTNDATYTYRFACDQTNKTFELNASFESKKYKDPSPSLDLDGNDGGNQPAFYEVGTDAGLDL